MTLGRSRSTPGLVESRGKLPLEELTAAAPSKEASSSVAALLGAHPPSAGGSPVSSSRPNGTTDLPLRQHPPTTATAADAQQRRLATMVTTTAASPFREPHPVAGTTTADLSGNASQAGTSPASTAQLIVPSPLVCGMGGVMGGSSPQPPSVRDASQEALLAEIKRLRERLVTLEAENATMSVKLSQQQWEVENRLAEIELQICGGASPESSGCSSDEHERNRESII